MERADVLPSHGSNRGNDPGPIASCTHPIRSHGREDDSLEPGTSIFLTAPATDGRRGNGISNRWLASEAMTRGMLRRGCAVLALVTALLVIQIGLDQMRLPIGAQGVAAIYMSGEHRPISNHLWEWGNADHCDRDRREEANRSSLSPSVG